jgi:hypothetical protein
MLEMIPSIVHPLSSTYNGKSHHFELCGIATQKIATGFMDRD